MERVKIPQWKSSAQELTRDIIKQFMESSDRRTIPWEALTDLINGLATLAVAESIDRLAIALETKEDQK